MDQISGSVERITYYNEENGYTVLRLKPDTRGMLPFKYGREDLVTAVGNLPEINEGEWLKLSGKWTSHPRHGRQFMVELCEQSLPASTEGIKRYLGSGLIRGVGKKMAERIVDRFGTRTLDVIEGDPQRLREVSGIGQSRVEAILKAWEEQRAIKDVMIFLQSHHISTNLAIKIYKQYGDEALMVVQNEPYKLVQDVRGIGFKTADRIAKALGLAHDAPARIEAGIGYTLSQMSNEGHVYVPEHELQPKAAEILQLPVEAITAVLATLEHSDHIKREKFMIKGEQSENIADPQAIDAVYLTPFFYAEIGTANRLKTVIQHPTSRLQSLKRQKKAVLQQQVMAVQPEVQLAQEQTQGVVTAVTHKVTVLTGGPGTGKTTCLRALIGLLDRYGQSYALASPTGRAAKRLAEATDREAKTIHRLLEFKPGEGFARHQQNPIDVDIVVIDEASMLDLLLMHALIKAVGIDSHLLLVGDIDQLPSVGAGNVLRDLIVSGVTAVVRLSTIFRQAAQSLIIQNAHRINSGAFPLTPKEAKDFFLFVKDEPEEAAHLLVDVVHKRIPHKFGFDPIEQIQVLAPMYAGMLGVSNLNGLLQKALNPAGGRKVERRLGGRTFRVGDKVMQTVNNYDKNVYNGDIGRIISMDLLGQTFTVNMEDQAVVYDFMEADELVHAYAVSIHKAQGSEYPCVVMPVATQHYMMLQRNLLYTGITRAKQVVILVGTRRALHIAINNADTNQRHTALDYRLQN